MTRELTKKELYTLRQDLRNAQHLHQAARHRVVAHAETIRLLKEENRKKDEVISAQQAAITALKLRVEDLERMVFGTSTRKKAEENDADDDCGQRGDKSSDDAPPRTPRSRESYHRPIPERITETKRHPIDQCPTCCHPLEQIQTRSYYEEDIVLPLTEKEKEQCTTAVKHEVERGYCPQCKKWRSAVPLPTTTVVLGRSVRIYIITCSLLTRLSYEQIRTQLATFYGFPVSDGEIAAILAGEARAYRPEYEALTKRIRAAHAVHYDETSYPVQGLSRGNWAWAMTPAVGSEVLYALGESRGKGVAKRLKGDGAHIGISDHLPVYDLLFLLHQLCWAHPHRKFRDLASSSTLSDHDRARARAVYEAFSILYADLRAVLKQPFDQERYAAVRAALLVRFDAIAQEDEHDFETLAKRKAELRRGRDCYFTCLLYPDVPCDNNKAERVLRHLVIKRRTSFGSKTERGAEVTSVLLSVVMSLFNSKPKNFFGDLLALRAPKTAL